MRGGVVFCENVDISGCVQHNGEPFSAFFALSGIGHLVGSELLGSVRMLKSWLNRRMFGWLHIVDIGKVYGSSGG